MFENIGEFKCFEDVGIIVEYVNYLFLIKKLNGSFCLVIVFVNIGWYSKL